MKVTSGEPTRRRDRRDAVAGLTDDGDVGLRVDDEPRTLTHQVLVVRDHDSDHGTALAVTG